MQVWPRSSQGSYLDAFIIKKGVIEKCHMMVLD